MHRLLIITWLIVFSTTMMAECVSDRPLVGVVLGGGGAKGAAEVGALKVLEELDTPIDFIAGTSIGAIVGGLYACGYKAEDLEQLFQSQEWLDLFSNRNKRLRDNLIDEHDGTIYILGFPILNTKAKAKRDDKTNVETGGPGFFSGRQITHLLDSLTKPYDGVKSFDQLPIPFRCVAVDLKTQEEVVMDSCELELAMRASMAIPGVFKPVKWKGRTLVDGGMMNNLPVDVVRAMGADLVIAIDLDQVEHEGSDFSLKETLGIGGLLDWAISRPDWKKNRANREDADVYICPDLADFDVSSFSQQSIIEMVERGASATRAKTKEIKQLMKIKKKDLEK